MKVRPEEQTTHANWRRRIQLALPLSVGLALVAAFLFLLYRHGQEDSTAVVTETKEPEAKVDRSTELERLRKKVPSDQIIAKPSPRGKDIRRWRIEPLPEGWNAEIAARIAELFGTVDYEPSDAKSYLAAEKALEELEEYLASLGPDALPTLAAILNAETFFINRRRLLSAIGNLGPESEEATFILLDYFNKRIGDHQARSELNYVAKAMKELKNDTSYEVIRKLIDSKNVPAYDRANFVVALGEHPRREESIPLFVDIMSHNNEFRMRNYAAQALGKIATPESLPDLMNAFERERYWVAKQTILGTMGKIASPSSLAFLEEVARTANETGVRLSAASAIRRIGTHRARSILRELAQVESDAQVRGHMMRWLEN